MQIGRKGTSLAVALILALMTLLSGCGQGQEKASPAPGGTAGNLAPIKLGVVAPLTGPSAAVGEYISHGAQLAAEEINKAGGVQVPGESGKRQIELVLEDDQANPQAGINAIQKLLTQSNVHVLLGPDFSGVTYPSLYLAEEAKVPQITSSLAPKITAENKNWIVRSRTTDSVNAEAIVTYFVEELKLQKIAMAYTNVEYGKTGIEWAEKVLKEKYKQNPVAVVSHNSGDKDLTASATKIIESGADGVIAWGLQGENALLLKALRRLGWTGRFYFSTADAVFAKLLSQQELNGVIGVLAWVPEDPSPKSQEFVKNYKAKWGNEPEVHSSAYYDSVHLVKAAIEAVGLDQAKIRDWLRDPKGLTGVQGTYKAGQVKNGDISTFATVFEYDSNGKVQVKKKYE